MSLFVHRASLPQGNMDSTFSHADYCCNLGIANHALFGEIGSAAATQAAIMSAATRRTNAAALYLSDGTKQWFLCACSVAQFSDDAHRPGCVRHMVQKIHIVFLDSFFHQH
jgi:hypothetical protein